MFAGRNPDGEALLTRVPTGCVLHDSTARRCELQHALGHAALPLACRQFPRITVHDPARGRRVLSLKEASDHYTGVAMELTPASGFAARDGNVR